MSKVTSHCREQVAAWMLTQGFATGHGDTLDDLLGELAWQIEELRDALSIANAALTRRLRDG